MDNRQQMRELALFAGAGGGILGGHLLGWRTVCAVEIEPYAASVLIQRQNEGILEPFPVWDDVCTFNGVPWRGKVDVVSGGFPCQDISCAGKGAGIDGERSGLWREMHRIISEVRPRYAFVENSPMLVKRGLTRVLRDLAEIGYDAAWTIIGADDVGAPHIRKRIWILSKDTERSGFLSHAQLHGTGRREQLKKGASESHDCTTREVSDSDGKRRTSLADEARVASETRREAPAGQSRGAGRNVSDTAHQGDVRGNGQLRADEEAPRTGHDNRRGTPEDDRREWWSVEPGLGRVANGIPNRVDRLKAIGNAQVPLVAATAFRRLKQILENN